MRVGFEGQEKLGACDGTAVGWNLMRTRASCSDRDALRMKAWVDNGCRQHDIMRGVASGHDQLLGCQILSACHGNTNRSINRTKKSRKKFARAI